MVPLNGFEYLGEITEEQMMDAAGHYRCPMCGCTLGYGAYDHGYGDYAEVEFCYSEACDYEEYL